jgi:hypothetical protein
MMGGTVAGPLISYDNGGNIGGSFFPEAWVYFE